MSRLLYNTICQSVASTGYNVISIDHPYDADVVEFPDGKLVYATNISTNPQLEKAVAVRVADVRFVLDSAPSLIPNGMYKAGQPAVVFGHSLGGATAAQALFEDSRLLGGINFDGGLFGSVVSRGLKKPFLIFASTSHNQSGISSWSEIWPKLSGPKLQLTLQNSTHGTFTDYPFLADALDLYNIIPPSAIQPLIGTLNGKRALNVIHEFTAAWLDLAYLGFKNPVLERPTNEWPEVQFTNGTIAELIAIKSSLSSRSVARLNILVGL